MKRFVGVLYGMLVGVELHNVLFGMEGVPGAVGLVEAYEKAQEEKLGRQLHAWERVATGCTSARGYVGFLLYAMGEETARRYNCAPLCTMPLATNMRDLVNDNHRVLLQALNAWEDFGAFCLKRGVKVRGALQLVVDEELEASDSLHLMQKAAGAA